MEKEASMFMLSLARQSLPFTILIPLCGPICAIADEITIAEIESAWRDREARIQSAEIIANVERTTTTIIAVTEAPADPFSTPLEAPPDAPKRVKNDSYEVRVTVEGISVRVEDEGTGKSAQFPKVWAINDEAGRKMYWGGKDAMAGTSGLVYLPSQARGRLFSEVEYRPIFEHIRPLQIGGGPLDGFSVSETYESPEGEVVVLKRQSPSKLDQYWLNRNLEFAITRMEVRRNGQPWLDREISYKGDPEVGPVLASWRQTVYYHNGPPYKTFVGTVTDSRFNFEVSEETFDLDFPRGTLVADRRPKPEEERRRNFGYVSLGEDTVVPISKEDIRSATDRRDLARKGEARNSEGQGSGWWIPTLLILGLAVLVSVWLYRKRVG